MPRVPANKGRRKRERTTASRPDLPGPRRRTSSGAKVTLTMDDLREKPGMLVGVGDLVAMGIVPSYMALRRQLNAHLFPEPKTLPSRLLVWEARQIVEWFGSMPTRPSSRTIQN